MGPWLKAVTVEFSDTLPGASDPHKMLGALKYQHGIQGTSVEYSRNDFHNAFQSYQTTMAEALALK
jgi:hypothetical protein